LSNEPGWILVILRSLKAGVRFKALYPFRYAFDRFRAKASGAWPPCCILLTSDGASYTSEQQFAPLLSHRSDLRRRLGVVLDYRRIGDVLAAPSQMLSGYDAVIAKLSFSTPEPTAIAIIKSLKQNSGRAKLIYFDGDDDLCVQWGSVLEFVDLYVKKQVFADSRWYLHRFTGKSNLTDYIAQTHNRSFVDNSIPQSGTIEARHLQKITLGYNIALDPRIVHLFRVLQFRPKPTKDIDIVCRASASADDWMTPFRLPIGQAFASLSGGYKVILPEKRVSQQQYHAELSRSRICISPFGYGEICWRDFEAIIHGCLLVKPRVDHLRTEPNVFVPGETYVPVRWDFTDLAETCARYLGDRAAMAKITQRAYDVLAEYYERFRLVDRFRELLAMVDLVPRTRPLETGIYHSGGNNAV
jgi:hypothetical protein